ncbi:sarcosine oxidase subunit gamma [Sneathiella chinensis]|uniref:Sarcosine oxidase subunit gamma n=1 Tax=Sneathiella chinensis TaxID=349750 RepID=A0ABQ5U4F9_9PROT|nr:sarcosine oxidase subunit gamma family protein [Sneathiella chinensis]GLQ06613.1 hypothetical protein GCM10007924_18340 [Sneathiella chinensis]
MAKYENWLSPVAALAPSFPQGLEALPFCAQVNLRGNPGDPEFMSRVKGELGFALPTVPNTVAGRKKCRALWLGPDEWLIVEEGDARFRDAPEGALAAQLEQALEGLHHAVTDVSANRIRLELSGPEVRTVLMKSCELDCHPAVFRPGQVAQTLLAKAQVILEKPAEDRVHLYVRNSFALYVAEWLVDAFRYSGE